MEIKEITEQNIWEKFIADTSPQSLFQSWNWGEVEKNVKSQKSNVKCLWRIGIYEKEKLLAIAQVTKVIARRGTYLHIRHGPVLINWKKEYFLFVINCLKKLANKEKASFIRISPLIENSERNIQFLKSFGFMDSPIHAMDGEYCWIIDVTKSEEQLLSEMRKTTRYLIKQAQKMDIKIVKSREKRDLVYFLKLYRKTAQRQKFIEHSGIEEEFGQYLKDDEILLFKVYFQEKLLSAALVIFYNNQAIYHHSASIEQKIPVNYLMQWEIIKEAKKRGKRIYNMWGITPDDKVRHPWKGLTIFKKGFGGQTLEYLHAQDLPCSLLYCTTYMLETFRRIWKGY